MNKYAARKKFYSLIFAFLIIFQMFTPILFSNEKRCVVPQKHYAPVNTSMFFPSTKIWQNQFKNKMHIIKEERKTENRKSTENEKVVTKTEKVSEEEKSLSLEEMKNNPLTLILDFLPYLQGTFEENLQTMAELIYMESQGNTDLEQQLQGLVLLGRSFYPGGKYFSDGTGSLESALFWEGQYPWAAKDISWIKPDEQSYRNAKAVLTGNVLDSELTKGITRNVVYANTVPQGSGIYTTTIAYNGDVVYFCYV